MISLLTALKVNGDLGVVYWGPYLWPIVSYSQASLTFWHQTISAKRKKYQLAVNQLSLLWFHAAWIFSTRLLLLFKSVHFSIFEELVDWFGK